MNERIKEFVNEVGFVGYGEDAGEYRIPTPAFNTRIEWFAELIIRDVLNFIEDEEEEAGGDWRCKDGWNIYHKIRERYRVEDE